jgi:hypothetical protein
VSFLSELSVTTIHEELCDRAEGMDWFLGSSPSFGVSGTDVPKQMSSGSTYSYSYNLPFYISATMLAVLSQLPSGSAAFPITRLWYLDLLPLILPLVVLTIVLQY